VVARCSDPDSARGLGHVMAASRCARSCVSSRRIPSYVMSACQLSSGGETAGGCRDAHILYGCVDTRVQASGGFYGWEDMDGSC
jgi:hypothetical protein